ncbi:MAG: hypothetical protein NVS4B1_27130 [Ktedonobacteraceae bacterium]
MELSEEVKECFPRITTLVINLDNSPESHSRRTQFMHRLVECAQHFLLTIRLAYYPPDYSKYNPIECCWGILAQHWNGAFLDSLDAVIQYASTMYDLERTTSPGRTRDHRLSNRGQID